MAASRVRRARLLQVNWREGVLTIENVATQTAVSAAPITVEILDRLGEWTPMSRIPALLPEYSAGSVRSAVRTLLSHTLLVQQGSAVAKRDDAIATEWQAWLPHAGFHFATKDVAFADPDTWARLAADIRAAAPPPAITKQYPRAPRVPLPEAAPANDAVLQALMQRRTHRTFGRRPVPLDRLATLLRYTWGSTGTVDSPLWGPLLLKTSPSGGARHPAEVYVVVMNVEGVAPGLYHYDHRHHRLSLLRAGRLRRQMLRLAVGQEHVAAAGAVCIMTAVIPRSIYKYRTARAYRVLSLETGHVAQNFCLLATHLGLAPFTTAAMHDTGLEALIGIDGVTETALYLAGVGMPVDTPSTSATDTAGNTNTDATRNRALSAARATAAASQATRSRSTRSAR